ncbi:WXG100 family type VII secretion target [Streptomyces lushanensis]|uniref:WXG100 family type VII secretion target n=1 Tax=Streptomyces lushanensis TaxID=1434255 RepID=UPI00082AAD0C|nr:WXG100 family type VII secretion target [Streptomyces lushanensis]
MLDNSGGGGYAPVSTDFEGHTHQELRGMIAAANPGTLKDHADLLAEAARAIETIGQDLKTYITSVDWRGEAGEAFETWGDQTWKATLLLADYTEVGAIWMGDAAQTLGEVKAGLPPVDTSAQDDLQAAREFHNDPDSRTIASEARAKLNEDHAEAVRQMTKLAQSYALSSSVMGAQDPPVFPPPPQAFVPDAQIYGSSDAAWSTGSSGGGGSGPDAYRTSSYHAPADSRTVTPVTVQPSQVQPLPPAPERPVAMEIDGVATLPTTQLPPAGTPHPLPPAGRPEGGVLPPVGVIPPAFGAGSPAAGGGRAGGVRPPSLSGQGPLAGSPGARSPRDSGIVGGRPVPPQASGRPSGGIPRGTVVGGEAMHGRPPTGGAVGGATGGGTGASGGTAGRRLAGETGGMVAGRPQQPGTTGGRPFTPGGSGLVRGAGADGGSRAGQAGRSGVVPHSPQRPGRRPEDEDGQRPDYLTEDEETWRHGGRRIVPPVID